MSLSIEELKRMQAMNIIANAEDIFIDTEKCVETRIKSFIEQTGNPFAQNIGEYILQIDFMEETNDLIDDRMIWMIKKKTQIMV